MVRLKESLVLYIVYTLFISIPYGAIKSDNDDNIKIENNKFQFLMVRLKVIKMLKYHLLIINFNSLWCD